MHAGAGIISKYRHLQFNQIFLFYFVLFIQSELSIHKTLSSTLAQRVNSERIFCLTLR